jgi:hypothetical protein
MAGWLSENATPIITACSALIGVGVTSLMNIWVNRNNARSSREARESQNQFDKWKTNREFYVNKAEEVFTLLDKWSNNANQVYLLQTLRATGAKSQEDLQQEWLSFVDHSLHPRITMFLTLYYMELLESFNEISSINGKMHGDFALFITGELTASDFCFQSMNANTSFNQKMVGLKLELARLTQIHF